MYLSCQRHELVGQGPVVRRRKLRGTRVAKITHVSGWRQLGWYPVAVTNRRRTDSCGCHMDRPRDTPSSATGWDDISPGETSAATQPH